MRLYLDTNVIMDFLLERDSAAHLLLMRALRCEFTLVLSTLAIEELSRHQPPEEVQNVLTLLEPKLFRCAPTSEDRIAAAQSTVTHYADALHHIIAVAHADMLVTKNIKDFPFTDIPIRRPDEL